MYVVLSKAEKHLPYGVLVGTTEGVTLLTGCCTNRGRDNRVQLHFVTAGSYKLSCAAKIPEHKF